jgi:hypothetical protein
MLAGVVSSQKDLLFYTLTIDSCLMTVGIGLLSTVSDSFTIGRTVYGFEVFVSVGFGLSISTSSILAAIQCEIKDHGKCKYS